MITFTIRIFLVFALFASSAGAQEFPNKPIRIVVPYSPGGGTDTVARLMAERLSITLKQSVIVENKPGASANIGADFVARSPADGYTILLTAPNFTTSEVLFSRLGWKFEDFTPVIHLVRYGNLLVASPSAPFSSLQEVIAAAKAKPGSISFGSAGAGSNSHLGMELLSLQAGISMQHVPYKGSGPMKTDLLGGHVLLGADGFAGLSEMVKAGRLKALAVLAPQRSPLSPDIPSLGDAGIHNVDANGWSGALLPVGTPPAVVARLHEAFATALQEPEVIARLKVLGVEPVGGSSEEFRFYLLN
jgi:tripartite-type tricarboxylate transporter receptor subunit TctC